MNKKVIGILVMTLFIGTAVLPLLVSSEQGRIVIQSQKKMIM